MNDCNNCMHCRIGRLTEKEWLEKKELCQTYKERRNTNKAFSKNEKRLVVWCEKGVWHKPFFVMKYVFQGRVFMDKFGLIRINETTAVQNCEEWEGDTEDGDSTSGIESTIRAKG